MSRKLHTLLNDLEAQHLRMRGCIDALILLDDTPSTEKHRWRDAAATLHVIAGDALNQADRTLADCYAAAYRRRPTP